MPENSVSALAVYTARPTIRIDTQAYPMVSELIQSLEMTESEGGMSTLEMRVINLASDTQGSANFAFEDDKLLHLGAVIQVYAGDEDAPMEIFRGVITALEADFSQERPPELIVLAEDSLQQARMTRRSKVYDNAKIADIAKEIAGNIGAKPVITGLTQDIGTQVQLDESDLVFLRRLLQRYDGDLQMVGAEMHVSPRVDVKRGDEIELELSSQLFSVRVLADLSQQVTELSVTGWDVKLGARVSATGRGANLGPGSGRKGSEMLEDAIGERKHHLSHLAAKDQQEAQSIADAAFDQRARRFVVVEGTAEGNPALRVGTNVKLSKLGGRFDNTYYVVRVCHHFDLDHGYKTDFEAECAFLGRGS